MQTITTTVVFPDGLWLQHPDERRRQRSMAANLITPDPRVLLCEVNNDSIQELRRAIIGRWKYLHYGQIVPWTKANKFEVRDRTVIRCANTFVGRGYGGYTDERIEAELTAP
jgi:hypothetical protein